MIEEANKVFKKNNILINIQTRGHHDLEFNWDPPKKFSKGYKSETAVRAQDPIEDQIGHYSKASIDVLKKTEKPKALTWLLACLVAKLNLKIIKKGY